MNIGHWLHYGCEHCYARNNVKRWHMIDDSADPELPVSFKMIEKKSAELFLLVDESDLSWMEAGMERQGICKDP